jgi:hypothetical protein
MGGSLRGRVDMSVDIGGQSLEDGEEQLLLTAEVVIDAADAGTRPSQMSAIVAAVNPRAAKTSVAASRMRSCVASVFARRRAGMTMKDELADILPCLRPNSGMTPCTPECVC